MYYNIKIKCDGCEFSLDSCNKEIVECEMDKYFATMFGASDEFKSQIKDVEIVNSDIKSIEDFKKMEAGQPEENDISDNSSVNDAQVDFDTNENENTNPKIEDEVIEDKVQNIEEDNQKEVLINEQADNGITESYCEPSEFVPAVETPYSPLEYSTFDFENEEKKVQNDEVIDALFALNKSSIAPLQDTENLNRKDEFEKINLDDDSSLQKNIDNDVKSFDVSEKTEVSLEDDIVLPEVNQPENNEPCNVSSSTPLYPKITISNEQISQNNGGIDDLIAKVEQEINAIDISDSNEFNKVLLDNSNVSKKTDFVVEEELVLGDDDIIDVSSDLDNKIKDEVIDNNELLLSESKEENQDLINEPTQMADNEEIIAQPQEETETKEITEEDNVNLTIDNQESENINQAKLDDIFSDGIKQVDENQADENQNENTTNILDGLTNPVPSYEEYLEQLNGIIKKNNLLNNKKDKQPLKSDFKSENIDFKTYLANFKYSNLIDEFLICSYYIKNILKQNSFSMKTINSNLYASSGEIADLSVVNELINLGCIKTVEVEEKKQYTITPYGETYFISKFQS